MSSSDDRPQIQNGIKGTATKPKKLDLTNKTVIMGISNGNRLQQGGNLKNTLLLLKHFHGAEKIIVCETSALKAFSIASTLLLDPAPDERNQKYKQAIIARWEKADLATIWKDVQEARAKFIDKKDLKSLGELQTEVEQEKDYVLGLVIKAQQSYGKWLTDNPYLTDKFKQEHTVEIINWLTQIQNKKVVSAVTDLIKLYSGNIEDRNVAIFKKAVDLSINEALSRKSIKIDLTSLTAKLSALYVIEESGMVKTWGDIEPNQNPTYNALMYINKLNKAMYQVLNKHVWKADEKGSELKVENLEFRRINFKEPKHPLYEDFWDQLENVDKKEMTPSLEGASMTTLYDRVLAYVKFSLDFFLSVIEAPYIPGFVLKLIEYIDANFEELDKVLSTILPPSNKTSSIEEAEKNVLNFLEIKVRSIPQLDFDKSSKIMSKVTLFGNTYLNKVNLQKEVNDEPSVEINGPIVGYPQDNKSNYFSCTIM
ncbi:MAG: hypothetical protein K0S11_102 [Gammaproteobacteria bacterium]|nr:hypothetical protein [Gammaproteobacteria bacterium]